MILKLRRTKLPLSHYFLLPHTLLIPLAWSRVFLVRSQFEYVYSDSSLGRGDSDLIPRKDQRKLRRRERGRSRQKAVVWVPHRLYLATNHTVTPVEEQSASPIIQRSVAPTTDCLPLPLEAFAADPLDEGALQEVESNDSSLLIHVHFDPPAL